MQDSTLEMLVNLAAQLSAEDRAVLIQRLLMMSPQKQRPTEALLVFHVDHFPEHLNFRRENEYSDDER